MNIQNLTVSITGGMLMGAGLQTIAANFNHGLILVGIGVGLQVLVAVLQKFGVPITATPPQA